MSTFLYFLTSLIRFIQISRFLLILPKAIDRTMIRVNKIKKTALQAIKAVECNQLELVVMGCLLPNDISSRL